MYKFNLDNLTFYDWTLVGMFMYDRSVYNLWYLAEKTLGYSITDLPLDEVEKIYAELGNIVYEALRERQVDITLWADEKIREAADTAVPDVPMPDAFKRFIDGLE